MKSDKRTWSENSNAVGAGSSLTCTAGTLGLLLFSGSLLAQQFPDKPLYVPRAKEGAPRKASEAPPPAQPKQPAFTEPAGTVVTEPAEVPSTMPPLAVKRMLHEVSVSGDFMLGQGEVTLPVGYSLSKSLGSLPNQIAPQPSVAIASRDSDYFGGTVSYSYKKTWALDLSYSQGTSSGNNTVKTAPPPTSLGNLKTDFSIDDQLYQIYARYAFPGLRTTALSAYLRVGATYGQATLKARQTTAGLQQYSQTDDTEDILGNLGAGIGYTLYSSRRVIIELKAEGEGFYGFRTQNSRETLSADPGLRFEEVSIDNTLYGGIGRGTVNFQYSFGQTRALKVFFEGGAQAKYTIIEYPNASAPNELLWGPYVKVGLRYAF